MFCWFFVRIKSAAPRSILICGVNILSYFILNFFQILPIRILPLIQLFALTSRNMLKLTTNFLIALNLFSRKHILNCFPLYNSLNGVYCIHKTLKQNSIIMNVKKKTNNRIMLPNQQMMGIICCAGN